MGIETKNVTKTLYVTSDGKEHLTMSDAQLHERSFEYVKYFDVFAHPDLTEGRHGPSHIGHIEVVSKGHHELFVEHACYSIFGNKVKFCMGVFGSNAIIPNWRFSQSTTANGNLIATVQDKFCKLQKYKHGVNRL